MSFRTHYDNLKVREDADPEVIRRAYRALIQKWHPDKNPNTQDHAERVTRVINAAYVVLSNPELRKTHDLWIESKRKKKPQQRKTTARQRRAKPEAKTKAKPKPKPASKRAADANAKSTSRKTLYDILKVSQEATDMEIIGAHRRLVQRWHSDKHFGYKRATEQNLKWLNRAREILTDSRKRALYDNQLSKL